eukprot:TRINITY_DN1569_c1_g1_i1.p1 TRINITY_DN1569_c1_g1~~TRINITY_DN1569_c1_g1_i1.p1  ORF type:complete len:475 (-),score=129.04 TRINITY_DN1569_c1_g1_i1:131-1555(-)
MAFQSVPNKDADRADSGLSGEDEEIAREVRPSNFGKKRVFAIGAGLLGLAGCAGAAVFANASSNGAAVSSAPAGGLTARALLEHPDFIEAASQNIWALGQKHPSMQGKEHKLKPAVARMMASLSQIIAEQDPEGTQHLDNIGLSMEQKNDVVSVVKRMGDHRVQSVGQEVLQLAVKHKDDKDIEGLQDEVKSVFTPRKQELASLKEQVLPDSIRQKVEQLTTPTEEQQRRLKTTSTHPATQLTNAMGNDMGMKIEDALGMIGGLAEQARLALDEANTIGTSFGTVQHHVPWYWRSLVGGLAFGTETMDCILRQDDIKETDKKTGQQVLVSGHGGSPNTVKMAMCPMKYAGAGMDFISGVNNAMGIQNSKLPYDFQMMFGGQPQAGFNPAYGAAPARAPTNPFSMFAPQQQQQPQQQHPLNQLMGHAMNAMQGMTQQRAPATGGFMMPQQQHAGYMMPQQQAYHPVQHPGFAYPR